MFDDRCWVTDVKNFIFGVYSLQLARGSLKTEFRSLNQLKANSKRPKAIK